MKERFREFERHLLAVSESLPKEAVREVHSQIERASEDIKSAAEAALTNDREAFFSETDRLSTMIREEAVTLDNLLGDPNGSAGRPSRAHSMAARTWRPRRMRRRPGPVLRLWHPLTPTRVPRSLSSASSR